MEDLHDSVDNLRDAEEVNERTTKVWITVLILVITILGTIAATLASLADAQAVTTQRQQEIQALGAEQDQQAEAADSFANTESNNQAQLDFERDAAWWIERTNSSPETVQATRTFWLQSSQAWNNAVSASYNGYYNMYAAAERSTELAVVDGQDVAAWRDKEDGYITAAAVLAVSLFLVGLVLASHGRSSRRIFVIAGVLLTLFASIRLVQTYARQAPAIGRSTLTAFVNGELALNEGENRSAATSFEQVVAERPLTPEAWLGLASALDSQAFPSRSSLIAAVAAYRRVIAEGEGSLLVWNNLASDELFLGQLRSARRDLVPALQTRNDAYWAYAEGTLAEINMASGDLTAAFNDLATAVDKMDPRDTQDIEDFFAILRGDQAYFSRAGVAPARWRPFYARAEIIEASLDALHSPTPGPRGDAAISSLSVRYYNIDPADNQGLICFQFAYRGFTKPGIFSFRTYDYYAGQYTLLEASSATRTDTWSWGNGNGSLIWYVPLAVTYGHTYHIEFYWNGNLLASTPIKVLSK